MFSSDTSILSATGRRCGRLEACIAGVASVCALFDSNTVPGRELGCGLDSGISESEEGYEAPALMLGMLVSDAQAVLGVVISLLTWGLGDTRPG